MRRVVSLTRMPHNYGLTPSSSRLFLDSVRQIHRMEPASYRNHELLINRGDLGEIKPTNIEHQPYINPENAIAQLREECSKNSRISDGQVSRIFRLFIEKAEIGVVRSLFQEFASTNAKLYVRDNVVLIFLERIVREERVSAATQFAIDCRKMFVVKPPTEQHGIGHTIATEKLFQAAFASEKVKYIDVFGLYDTLYELGYIADSKPYLVEALKFKLKQEGFNETLLSYKLQLRHDRSSVGMHILFEEAIRQWEKSQITFEHRLRTIIKLASTLEDPFHIYGQLIVSLVVEGRFTEAKVLFQKLSIPGSHFCQPLGRLSRDEKYLPVVEKFVELIDSCIVAERKTKKNSASVKEEELCGNESTSSVAFLLDCWTLPRKKKKYTKIKRYKVNDEKLDRLNSTVIHVWADLAKKANDAAAGKRLKKWVDDNDISLSEKLSDRISNLQQELMF